MELQSVTAEYLFDRTETKAQQDICRCNAIFQGHITNPPYHTIVSSN